MARIVDAIATMIWERAEVVRVGLGMSIVASVFLVVQLLLFLEELWWRA